MHIRSDRQKLADGTTRTYLSLAHSIWVEGPMGKKRAEPVIFARLGIEEELDLDMVKSARDAFDRYLQRRLRKAGLPEDPLPADKPEVVHETASELRGKEVELRILTSRAFGLRALIEPLWKSLGLEGVLRGFAAEHRLGFDFERVVFGMVLNRLVDPKSKRACNEWLKEEAYFPEAEDWQVQHFYRALDVLEQHSEGLADHLMATVRERLPLDELKLLLADTTATYCESDLDDLERASIAEEWASFDGGTGPEPSMPRPQVVNEPPLRMRGHSKDRRPDKPQVVVGLVTGASGRVLTHRVFAGNRNDQSLAIDLFNEALRNEPDGDLVLVADSGLSGGPNLAAIDEAGLHRISTVPKRNSKLVTKILSLAGRWRQHPSKPHFKHRVLQLSAEESPSGRAEVCIATRNRKEADRQNRKLDKDLAKVRAHLAKDDKLDQHGKPTCKLLTKPSLRRLVRESTDGRRLVLDQKAIRLERKRGGVKVLRSTLVDHDPLAILAAYQQLLKVEDDFRTFKGPLRLRPMHHRSAHRIRAHVMICMLALVVLQELEHQSGWKFRDIVAAVSPVRASRMQQGTSLYWMRSEWPARTEDLLEALGQAQGPRTWGAARVSEDEASSGSYAGAASREE